MNNKKLSEAIEKALNFKLSEETMNKLIKVIEKEHQKNVRIRVHGEQGEQGDENAFLEAAKPLMKYMCENHHPHVTVIIDSERAELLEGMKSVENNDYKKKSLNWIKYSEQKPEKGALVLVYRDIEDPERPRGYLHMYTTRWTDEIEKYAEASKIIYWCPVEYPCV